MSGSQFVTEIENEEVDAKHRPYSDIRITHCGELVLLEKRVLFCSLVFFYFQVLKGVFPRINIIFVWVLFGKHTSSCYFLLGNEMSNGASVPIISDCQLVDVDSEENIPRKKRLK